MYGSICSISSYALFQAIIISTYNAVFLVKSELKSTLDFLADVCIVDTCIASYSKYSIYSCRIIIFIVHNHNCIIICRQ